MKDKLATWTMIAEIVGALAVVASLLFVGLQMRENTRATRSATASATNAAMSDWYSATANDEDASYIWWNFMTNPESLDRQQQFRAMLNCHSAILTLQNSYYLLEEGTLDESLHFSINQAIVVVKDTPGFRLYWKERGAMFNPEFREFIDGYLASDRNVPTGLYSKTESE